MINLPVINFFEKEVVGSESTDFACFHISHKNLHEEIPQELQLKTEGIFALFCIEGTLSFKLNEQDIILKSGNVCSFFTTNLFKSGSSSKDFSGYVLFLSSHYITRIDSHISITYFLHSFYEPILELSDQDIEVLSTLLRFAEVRINQPGRGFSKEILYHMLMILIYELCAIYDRKPVSDKKKIRDEGLVKDFLQLVNQNCEKEHSLAFYAGKLSITAKHLSLCIKKLTGHSGAEWIDYLLMLKIKKMLLTSPMTIQQVSDHFNFPDNSFFGKYFKKHAGITPREFRIMG
jgi:AraC-like DNA-binding protein